MASGLEIGMRSISTLVGKNICGRKTNMDYTIDPKSESTVLKRMATGTFTHNP